VKTQLGDRTGAARDRQACLAKTPTDPLSWCARGELRLSSDPAGALADFESALALDPDLLNALRGKASVLSEQLNRPVDAIKVVDDIMKIRPDSIGDRAGRAVLLARVGKAEEAKQDIDICARRTESAIVQYQLASAALVAGDKPRGLQLLRAAFLKDPLLGSNMPFDADLKSVWNDGEFKNLITAAGTLSRK
jgi:tetratricopeptide (TPR) repeat protein